MKYFDLSEFACPCCGQALVDNSLTSMLDRAREYAGIPFVVTSGYRCESHNAAVGGSSQSAHLLGMAADIACNSSRNRYLIIMAATKAGFNRIGIAKNFIHLDCDPTKPPAMVWLYD